MLSGSPLLLPVSFGIQCIDIGTNVVLLDTAGGYHGYWASDLYSINSNYGTAEDLKRLVNAAHEKVSANNHSFALTETNIHS